MADISDIEQALADEITGLLYPLGPMQASIIGVTCRIYRGWPNSATLNSDLAAGVANVTVVSDNEAGAVTTRYLREWQYNSAVPGVTAEVAGQTISIGGDPRVGDVVGALVDGRAYAYRVTTGVSQDLVAANLCTAIQTNRIATAHGPRINLPGAAAILVRAVCDNNAYYEGRRQEKDVRAICWCSTPVVRELLVVGNRPIRCPNSVFAAGGYHAGTCKISKYHDLRPVPECTALSARPHLHHRISYSDIRQSAVHAVWRRCHQ